MTATQHPDEPVLVRTIEVAALIDDLNQRIAYNAKNHPEMAEARSALNSLAESVLMEANAYRGFRYLTDLPDHDPTARHYFVADALR